MGAKKTLKTLKLFDRVFTVVKKHNSEKIEFISLEVCSIGFEYGRCNHLQLKLFGKHHEMSLTIMQTMEGFKNSNLTEISVEKYTHPFFLNEEDGRKYYMEARMAIFKKLKHGG